MTENSNNKPIYCHPERRRGARGMCIVCYNSWLRNNNPTYKENYKLSIKKYQMRPENLAKKRSNTLKRRYGITTEEYESMLKKQNYCCKICKRHTKLLVEHNHTTGQVRALTCNKCNQLIAVIDNDAKIMHKILHYVLTNGEVLNDDEYTIF